MNYNLRAFIVIVSFAVVLTGCQTGPCRPGTDGFFDYFACTGQGRYRDNQSQMRDAIERERAVGQGLRARGAQIEEDIFKRRQQRDQLAQELARLRALDNAVERLRSDIQRNRVGARDARARLATLLEGLGDTAAQISNDLRRMNPVCRPANWREILNDAELTGQFVQDTLIAYFSPSAEGIAAGHSGSILKKLFNISGALAQKINILGNVLLLGHSAMKSRPEICR